MSSDAPDTEPPPTRGPDSDEDDRLFRLVPRLVFQQHRRDFLGAAPAENAPEMADIGGDVGPPDKVRQLGEHTAVVFLDVVGFSTLAAQLEQSSSGTAVVVGGTPQQRRRGRALAAASQVGGELLARKLNALFALAVEAFLCYGGDVAKFCGDALIVVFYSSPDGGDDLAATASALAGSSGSSSSSSSSTSVNLRRALAACARIQQDVARLSAESSAAEKDMSGSLQCKLAIGVGNLGVVSVGDEDRRELLLFGAALEQATETEVEAGESGKLSMPSALFSHIDPEIERWFSPSSLSPQTHKSADAAALGELLRSPQGQQLSLCSTCSSDKFSALRPLSHSQRDILASYNLRTITDLSAELRTLSVIFCMVEGLDLHDVVDNAAPLHEVVSTVQRFVRRFGGDIRQAALDDKGFVIIAVFGLVRHEDDCLAAARCACALASSEIPVRVGLSRGRVFCGNVGSGRRCEVAAVGDAVNLSARLMVKCALNSALADNTTAKELAYNPRSNGIINVELFESQVMLKGQQEPVDIFRVTEHGASIDIGTADLKAEAAAANNVHSKHVQNLIEFIQAEFDHPVRSALVVGDAGTGKTTLLRQVLSSCVQPLKGESGGKFVLSLSAVEMDQDSDLFPWQNALDQFVVRYAIETRESAGARFTAVPDLVSELREVLVKAVSEMPTCEVVLTVEDVHWLDDASLRAVAAVLRGDLELPVKLAVLMTSRPESSFLEGAKKVFAKLQQEAVREPRHLISLSTLGEVEVEAVMLTVSRCTSIEQRLLRAIVQSTQGNPLMVREVTLALLHEGKLFKSAQNELVPAPEALLYTSKEEDAQIDLHSIPTGIEATVLSRIDRLPKERRLLLVTAAAIGTQNVEAGLVCDVANRWGAYVNHYDLPMVQQALESIRDDTGVLRVGLADELEFSHSLVRRAVESTLTSDTQKLLHRSCALTLAEKHTYKPAVLAYHFDLAGETLEAIKYYEEIAVEKLPQYYPRRVLQRLVDLYGTAAAANLPVDPRRRLMWWSMLLDCLFLSWRWSAINDQREEFEAFANLEISAWSRWQPTLARSIAGTMNTLVSLFFKGQFPQPRATVEFEVKDQNFEDARTWSAVCGSKLSFQTATMMTTMRQGKIFPSLTAAIRWWCAVNRVLTKPCGPGRRQHIMHGAIVIVQRLGISRFRFKKLVEEMRQQRESLKQAMTECDTFQEAVMAPSYVRIKGSHEVADVLCFEHDFVAAREAIQQEIQVVDRASEIESYIQLRVYQGLFALNIEPDPDFAHTCASEVLRIDQTALRGHQSLATSYSGAIRLFAELDRVEDASSARSSTVPVQDRSLWAVWLLVAEAQKMLRLSQWTEALDQLRRARRNWLPIWASGAFELCFQRLVEGVVDGLLIASCDPSQVDAETQFDVSLFLKVFAILTSLGLPKTSPPGDFSYPLCHADSLFIRCAVTGEVSLPEALAVLPRLAKFLEERKMTRGAGRALHLAAVLHYEMHGSSPGLSVLQERRELMRLARQHFESCGSVFFVARLREAESVLLDGEPARLSMAKLRTHFSRSRRRRKLRIASYGLLGVGVACMAVRPLRSALLTNLWRYLRYLR